MGPPPLSSPLPPPGSWAPLLSPPLPPGSVPPLSRPPPPPGGGLPSPLSLPPGASSRLAPTLSPDSPPIPRRRAFFPNPPIHPPPPSLQIGQHGHGLPAGLLHPADLLPAQPLPPGPHHLPRIPGGHLEGPVTGAGGAGGAPRHVEQEILQLGQRRQPGEAQQAAQLLPGPQHQVLVAQLQVAPAQPVRGGRPQQQQVPQPGLADHLQGPAQQVVGPTPPVQEPVHPVPLQPAPQQLHALPQQRAPGAQAGVVHGPRVPEQLHHPQVQRGVPQQRLQRRHLQQAHVFNHHHRVAPALPLQLPQGPARAAPLALPLLHQPHPVPPAPRRAQRGAAQHLAAPPAEEAGGAQVSAGVQAQRGEVALEEGAQQVAQRPLQAARVPRVQGLPHVPGRLVQVEDPRVLVEELPEEGRAAAPGGVQVDVCAGRGRGGPGPPPPPLATVRGPGAGSAGEASPSLLHCPLSRGSGLSTSCPPAEAGRGAAAAAPSTGAAPATASSPAASSSPRGDVTQCLSSVSVQPAPVPGSQRRGHVWLLPGLLSATFLSSGSSSSSFITWVTFPLKCTFTSLRQAPLSSPLSV
ncbi:hypothetical protein FKM82_019934 [Ascaphus truei]